MKNRLKIIKLKKFFRKRIALLSVLVGAVISIISICFLFVVYGAISTMINISGEGRVETAQTVSNYYYKEGYFYEDESCTEKVTLNSNRNVEIVTFQDLINQIASGSIIYMLSSYMSPIPEENVVIGAKNISIQRYIDENGDNLTFKDGSLIEVKSTFSIDATDLNGFLIIDGADLEYDSGFEGGIFNVNSGGVLNLFGASSQNIILKNSFAKTGGALFNNGNLTLSNCKITDNTAAQGGAIYNSGADVSAVIDGCLIKNNVASEYGGGINNLSNMTIKNSSVSNNSLTDGVAENGGGIYCGNSDYTNLTAEGQVIVENNLSKNGVNSNLALYSEFLSYKTMTSNGLSVGSHIGITTVFKPFNISFSGINIPFNVTISPKDKTTSEKTYFFSDDEKYEIDYVNNAIVLKVKGQTQTQETLSVEESQRIYREWKLYQEQIKSQEQNTQTDDETKNQNTRD